MKRRRSSGSRTSTHLFCGAGGDTEGLREAGYTAILAANHDEVSVATHAKNFPDAEHLICDINNLDMRRLPSTDVLWASPICKEITPAGGRPRSKQQPQGQLNLFDDGPVSETTWERTRATAYDVLRATEVHEYSAVLCENVTEFGTDWPLFRWWLQAMDILDYNHTIACVSAAHIGGDGNDLAPQWRDRLFVAFTRKGMSLPDLEPRPLALCVECNEDVAARQWWKDPKSERIGRYRTQYLYRCPNTKCRHAIVEPYVRPAAHIIDWSDVGQRIGDRKRPLAEATMRRIQIGLERFADQSVVVVSRSGGHKRPVRVGAGSPPLLVPSGGTWNEDAASAFDPMRTRTTRDWETVLTPAPFIAELRRNGTARSTAEPLSTITAGGTHHALVVPYYTKGTPKTAGQPFDTVTTKDRFALVTGPSVVAEDCFLRMVQPRESLDAQRFPSTYEVCGNKGQQTAQAGNAVPVNVAAWIGRQVGIVLDGAAA